MVSRSRYVDYSESGGVSLKFGLLSEDSVAAILFAYFSGVTDLVMSWGGGVTTSIGRLATWVSTEGGLIGSIFEIPLNAIDVGLSANAEFVGSFGPLSIIVAGIEILVIAWLVVDVIEYGVRRLQGALG